MLKCDFCQETKNTEYIDGYNNIKMCPKCQIDMINRRITSKSQEIIQLQWTIIKIKNKYHLK